MAPNTRYHPDLFKRIRRFYLGRIIRPALYLAFTAVLCIVFPISSILFPEKLANLFQMEELYEKQALFTSAKPECVWFTGYARTQDKKITGYFYYSSDPESKQYSILLLSPASCHYGLPKLENISLYGKILPADASYDKLLNSLAEDLSVSSSILRERIAPFYFSEPDYQFGMGILFLILLLAGCLPASLFFFLFLFFLIWPQRSLFLLKPEV